MPQPAKNNRKPPKCYLFHSNHHQNEEDACKTKTLKIATTNHALTFFYKQCKPLKLCLVSEKMQK